MEAIVEKDHHIKNFQDKNQRNKALLPFKVNEYMKYEIWPLCHVGGSSLVKRKKYKKKIAKIGGKT